MSNKEFDPFEDDSDDDDEIELCLNYNNKDMTLPKKKRNPIKNPKKIILVDPEIHKLIKDESIKTGVFMQTIAKEVFENRLRGKK